MALGRGNLGSGGGIKYATGTHSGSSGSTISVTLGWEPKFVIITGTKGAWLLTRDAFTTTVNTYGSGGSITGTTNYSRYGVYANPTESTTAYSEDGAAITSTGFSYLVPYFNSSWTYTWTAYAE